MNSKFVLKWEETPTFIEDGSVLPLQVLTHEEGFGTYADARMD
jgi:hypothetical protein